MNWQSRAFSGLPVIGLLTLVYFIAGKIGLLLASLHASASPVWPPAGIALAALLLLGYRAWPAIFVGAFLVNVTTAGNVATSLAIASGNTLEAVCGAWLVNRFAGGTTVFDRPQGVFKFALAAVVSTIISPAFGVTSLALAGFADWRNYDAIWLTWWLGDTMGDLLIAPLIILWSIASKRRWNRREAVEGGILLLLLFVLSEAVFGGWLTISARNYPIGFISWPIVIWTAFRFTQRETTTSIFILSAIAIWGTLNGFGPFVTETENQSLLALQSWMAVLTISAMALSAGMAERRRAEEALRESEARINLAANAANLGLWLWNIQTGELWVTEQWRKLFGFAESEPVNFDRVLEVVHPEERERMKQLVQHMFEHGGEGENEYRIMRPDGSTRWIAGYGSVELDERGKPAFARGVSRDITLRKHAEEELRESEGRFRLIADSAPVLIWMSGTDKLCNFFNKPWLEFTGRTVEQEMGNGWAEGVHPDDLQRCLQIYTEAFDARETFVMQYRLRRHDGEYRWISDNGVPRYDAEKNFTGYIGSCVDITESITNQQALRESEERMSLAMDAAKLGLWEWNVSKDELWGTKARRALLGLPTSGKIKLEHGLLRVHVDDRDRVRRTLKDAARTGEDYHLEYRVVLPDGTVQWTDHRGRCVRGADGKDLILRGISMDMTERKRAEEKFRMAVEASPSGILLVNHTGQIVLVNSQIEQLFGYGREELIGQSVEIFVPERFAGEHPEHRAKFFAAPAARAMGADRELFARRKDGSEFPVEIGLNPIQSPEGMLILAVVVDISARKLAQAEALRHREEVSHLSRVAALGELAASIAHELNQPLAGIVSNASAGQRFIDRGNVDLRELRELLGDVVADGRRAGEVIRSVRNMMKKGSLVRRPVNLNDVVTNVVRMVKWDATQRSCDVETLLEPDLPSIEGDPIQLQQVLLNLLINAFDAVRDTPLSRRKVVIVTERNGDDAIRTSIRDYGTGIAAEARDRLFDHFFTTKPQGLGMGLAIVRSIVESHFGTIASENVEGGGARFHFTLPVSPEKATYSAI
jgi:PAS domain S-box-containing protein